MTMQLGYRGSVNSWECDENDHLNVRFYVEKHLQTLLGWLAGADIRPRLLPARAPAAITVQHLRFLAESRLATPLSGYATVLDSADTGVRVLTELRHSFTDEILCTCVHVLAGVMARRGSDLPSYAAPRGVPDAELPHVRLPMASLEAHRFQTIGMGVVQEGECDGSGRLQMHNYMGRISDAMPHLWGALYAGSGDDFQFDGGTEGGAVLEYRLRYHRPLLRHQAFVIKSGVADVGAKVQRFAHLVFNSTTGELCVSAQAAGVRMDLTARRALSLSEERLDKLRSQLIEPLDA